MKKVTCLLVAVLMLLAGISAMAESELEQVRYTQVPGMPTQDFVLSFDEARNNAELVVTVQEPDQITKDALFAIYDFVEQTQKMPVRYFDEEVQNAVQAILPDGVSVDILYMTEFVQVVPQAVEANADGEAKVVIDVDYQPGQLVVVMIGDRTNPDDIQWTPLKAAVTELGTVEFVVPAELVQKVQGQDTIFALLTDRLGTRGGVVKREEDQTIITYPSKTANDIVVIEHPTGIDGSALPEDFEVRETEETAIIAAENTSIRSFVKDENKPVIRFYPTEAQNEAMLLLPEDLDVEKLVAYEVMDVDCVNYKHAFGDVLVRIKFATPYQDGQKLVVMLGLDREQTADSANQLDWVVLRSEVKDGYVNITFAQAALEIMEERPALMMVLSEPMAE